MMKKRVRSGFVSPKPLRTAGNLDGEARKVTVQLEGVIVQTDSRVISGLRDAMVVWE
jgi:hypothetical protein